MQKKMESKAGLPFGIVRKSRTVADGCTVRLFAGAGYETRTRYLLLGKQTLYQVS